LRANSPRWRRRGNCTQSGRARSPSAGSRLRVMLPPRGSRRAVPRGREPQVLVGVRAHDFDAVAIMRRREARDHKRVEIRRRCGSGTLRTSCLGAICDGTSPRQRGRRRDRARGVVEHVIATSPPGGDGRDEEDAHQAACGWGKGHLLLSGKFCKLGK